MEKADLSHGIIEKARACKSMEELVALAQKEGYELSDEQLSAVSGGTWGRDPEERACGGDDCDGLVCGDYFCERVTCPKISDNCIVFKSSPKVNC